MDASPNRNGGSYAQTHFKGPADRNAYMSFLEVQLERVSAACLQVSGFAEDMKILQNAMGC